MRIKSLPVTQRFTITDEEYGDAVVEIRQATSGDNIKRNDLVSEASLVVNDKQMGTEIKQRINALERFRYEVYLTLVSCDIVEEESEKAWFRFNKGRVADEAEFNVAWNKLPPRVSEKIHEKVLVVNPDWGRADADDPLD